MKKGDTEFRSFINDTLEKIDKDRWKAARKATAGNWPQLTPPTIDRYEPGRPEGRDVDAVFDNLDAYRQSSSTLELSVLSSVLALRWARCWRPCGCPRS